MVESHKRKEEIGVSYTIPYHVTMANSYTDKWCRPKHEPVKEREDALRL
jgi:hypothetical protein